MKFWLYILCLLCYLLALIGSRGQGKAGLFFHGPCSFYRHHGGDTKGVLSKIYGLAYPCLETVDLRKGEEVKTFISKPTLIGKEMRSF
jgi:hypothetical protein